MDYQSSKTLIFSDWQYINISESDCNILYRIRLQNFVQYNTFYSIANACKKRVNQMYTIILPDTEIEVLSF